MKKKIENMEFKEYYLREFQLYDGECDITFNLVGIDFIKEEITVAVSNKGRISVVSYDLLKNDNGYYFEYGIDYEKIHLNDFEEV